MRLLTVIEFDLILVNSYKLNDYLPSPWLFNHMVVRVTINDRSQFIDPTFSNQGGDIRDLYFPYYGNALVIKPKTDVEDTPMNFDGKTKVVEQYKLLDDNRSRLVVTTVHSGYQADNNRNILNSMSRTALEKNYLDYYTKLHPGITRIDTVKIKDNLADNQIEIIESYEISKFVKEEESTKKKYLTFFASDMFQQIPVINSSRLAPIYLSFPYTGEYEVQLISKQAKDIHNPPLFIDRDSYTLGKSIGVSGDTLKMNFQMTLHKPVVEVDEIPEFLDDFGNTEELFSYSYYLNDDGSIGYAIGGIQRISWLVVFISCLTLTLCGFVCYRWNQKEDFGKIGPHYYEVPQIGGWLIFFGLGLVVALLRTLIEFFNIGFFNSGLWSAYDTFGVSQGILFRAIAGFELILSLITISLLVFCIYLFFKKRDIFPKVALSLLAVLFLGPLIDLMLVKWSGLVFSEESEDYLELIRPISFSLIWGSYLLKSERVRDTFVTKYNNQYQYDSETTVSTQSERTKDEL